VYGGGVGLKENRTTGEHFNAQRNATNWEIGLLFQNVPLLNLLKATKFKVQSAPLSFYILFYIF